MKSLARKKRASGGGNNAPWLNTFADLMNLLLCFFVLLFAMSDVDAAKFDSISTSMANSIGIFEGGGSSVGTGNLISSGMTQMNELGDYYTNMGKASKQTGKDIDADEDSSDNEETNKANEGSQNQSGAQADQTNQGNGGTQDKVGSGDAELAEAISTIEEKKAEVSSSMYDDVSELTEKYNLGDYVELSIDPAYQYVQLTLKGSILFDSGDAELKRNSLPTLTSIGEILNKFKGYTVEITGHTDNVPMSGSEYKDNNWLSSARALNAADYLIKQCGLDPAFIKYSGRGEYEPIASNSTAEGRAKNRRIEIKIYNEYSGK